MTDRTTGPGVPEFVRKLVPNLAPQTIPVSLRMVREYLNGDMNEIDFYLDFPYELEKRYEKMCREDPDYADLIYYYLVENGADLHRSMTSEEFHDHIQKQYDHVMDGVY